MTRSLRFILIALAFTSTAPVAALAAEPVYVIRPPASVGMKSAGVLSNDAFSVSPAPGGQVPDSGADDGFIWKSEDWDGLDGAVTPWVRTTTVDRGIVFSFAGETGCRMIGLTADADSFFRWHPLNNEVAFSPLQPGRYGLVMSCDHKVVDGSYTGVLMTADVTVTN